MSKVKQPTASTATVGKVTLYGKGLKNPAREFDYDHAEKLLKMENTQWSKTPWPDGEKSTEGVDNSANQATDQ